MEAINLAIKGVAENYQSKDKHIVTAFSSIRFSLEKFNTKEELDIVIDAVKNVVSSLRSMVS